jgi:neutral ceramidase
MAVELCAAAVKMDITPPVGTPMDGFGARTSGSVGVHDPLLAQLLLLQLGPQRLVLITLDLLGVSLEVSSRVRAGIAEATGAPTCAIMVSCTHTHSGPYGLLPEEPGVRGPGDRGLQDMLVRKLVGAAIWAQQGLQPARLSVGRGWVEGIGANRNDPRGGLQDNEVIVLRWDGADGQPVAVWINYGCHATVMGEQNLWLSADFPGTARSALSLLYPKTVFLYANGASGDVSTRFTRREQGFQEVERLGRILAGEVLKVMQTATLCDVPVLGAVVEPASFARRPRMELEDAERQLKTLQDQLETLRDAGAAHGDVRRAETRVRGAMTEVARAKEPDTKAEVVSSVQGVRIGDVTLVGLPGEPFTQTVLEIKKGSPWPVTAVVSYANDEIGYFPDQASFSAGTYEALKSLFEIGATDLLRDSAVHVLRSLNSSAAGRSTGA